MEAYKQCPKCGGPLVKPASIGLPSSWGKLICPMNMPYQGCGWSLK